MSRISGAAPALACCASVLLLAACNRGSGARPGVPPRNVLLVTASSLRKDHLSAYMYARPTSTWAATEEERAQGRALALDDLAAQGVLFADAFSNATRTVPALCALFTGSRSAAPAGAQDDGALAAEAETLAERFQAAGFKTAAFVSGEFFLNEQRWGLEQGFSTWTHRFADAATLDQARQWLEQAEQAPGEPWFAWVHFAGCDPPHDPRGLPPLPGEVNGILDFSRLYSDPAYSGPADGGTRKYLESLQAGAAVASEQDRARLVDLYDGEVARLAGLVRTLALALRNLDESGARWKDTAFVFAGLHGVELGERGPRAWGADSLSVQALAIPLLLRHPGSLTGSRIMAEPVGIEDVGPTLCDWFRLPELAARERSASGRSLLALLDSFVRRPFERRPVLAERSGAAPARALRTREWTVVADGAGVHLYDRVADPAELADSASTRPEVAAERAAALERAAFAGARSP